MDTHIKERIENTINNIVSLPAIPEVASRILNMINNPDVSFKAVAEEISKDQAMTTNILKLCNSVYFSKGKQITSMDRAVITLGIKEVTNIVMIVATKPIMDKAVTGYGLAKGELWKQSLLVGTIAKKIAINLKLKDIADIVFTGGIIHNVGKTILAVFVQNAYQDIIDEVSTKNVTFSEAEKSIMGYCHQEISEKILEKWTFPPVLKAIVRFYSDPENAPEDFKTEVSIVHIASAISIMSGIGTGKDGPYYKLSDYAIKTIGIDDSEIKEISNNIPEIIKQMQEIQ